MVADKVWHFKAVPVPSATVATSFASMADARVVKAHPKSNYGASSTLAVDKGKASHLRFSVTGVTGTVERATVRLYVTNGSKDGPAIFRTSNTWSEKGTGALTWKNRPVAVGPALDDKGKVAASSWVEFDVTAAVAGNGAVSFVLTGSSTDTFAAYTKEGLSKRPQLVIVTR